MEPRKDSAQYTFRQNATDFTLKTCETTIEWSESCHSTKPQAHGSIGTRWVLAAKVNERNKGRPKGTAQGDFAQLTVHYVQHLLHRKLRTRQIAFVGPKSVCQACADTINRLLAKYDRPKRVLVFVNPQSGHKSARSVYQRKVAPIFALCGIDTTVIVTERHGHSKEVLKEVDLTAVDGIVCLGGDGTLSEVANGYLARFYRDCRVDSDKPNTILPRPPIPIGCIPLGSGDKIVGFMNETKSVTTAALHIVLGKSRGLDMASVHQHGELVAYTGLLAGYGLYGRLIQAIEARRWLPGRLRYSVVPLVELFKVRDFQAKVEFLEPAESSTGDDGESCEGKDASEEWRTVEGRFLGIDSFIIQLMPAGSSMRPYVGSGLAQMTIVKPCSRADHFSHFGKLMKRSPGFYDYSFIEEHWVKGYKVTAMAPNDGQDLPEIFLMNCDGEVVKLDQPEFEVRVHKQLIKLYTWLDEDIDVWP